MAYKTTSQELIESMMSVALRFGLTLYTGLVFMMMWGWFVVPTFELAELSYPVAVGILLILKLGSEFAVLPKEKAAEASWEIGIKLGVVITIHVAGFIFSYFV